MNIEKTKILISCVALTLFAGFFGSLATLPALDFWYSALKKPFFNPPNWLFGPAWTVLFVLMGISLFLIILHWQGARRRLKKPNPYHLLAFIFFGLQLLANVFWSYSFFYFQSPFLGLLNVVVLLFLIIATIVYFSRLNRLAAWLLVPYLLWTSFALILNFSIWWIN